jgi:hypothetical protein
MGYFLESSEQEIHPIPIRKPPFLYYVPSTFTFLETSTHLDVETDLYESPEGGQLLVQRMVVQLDGRDDLNGFLFLKDRASMITDCKLNPVTLQTGFSVLSYTEPSPESANMMDLCCELCSVRDLKLISISFLSTVHQDHLADPMVCFYSRTIKQFAKMTEWKD